MRVTIYLLLGLLASCGLHNEQLTNLSTKDLSGYRWQVIRMNGKPLINQTRLDFSISPDGQVKGNAGVNNYFGRWTIHPQKIESSVFGSTKMYRAQPEGVMEQEAEFLKLLQTVTHWKTSSKQLQFYKNEILIIELEAIENRLPEK